MEKFWLNPLIEPETCPKYLWVVLLLIGLMNLFQGGLHTFLVEFAATNIAGLDLSLVRDKLLNLMNAFGWSNIIEHNFNTDPTDPNSLPIINMPWLPLLLGNN